MSAATVEAPATASYAGARHDDHGHPGIPFSRVLHVEVRKLIDTSAGRWLLIATGGLTVLVVVTILIGGDAADLRFADLLGFAMWPLAVLLPVLGTLTATAEWSQRTGLVTFALEPHRGRVVIAKVLAAVGLGLGVVGTAMAGCALAYVAGTAAREIPPVWSIERAALLGILLSLVIYLLQGLAFGFMFLNTPLAIVTSLVLPGVVSAIPSLVSSAERFTVWLDLSSVTDPLMVGTMAGSDWAHLGTACGVWLALPMALGTWRVLTKEIA